MASVFDVGAWLSRHPPNSCNGVHVSQPVQLSVWTKASGKADGGDASNSGGGVAGHFRHGDTSGLLPFVLPRLPASLDEGRFIAKDEDEDVGVETVIRAAAAAAAAGAATATGVAGTGGGPGQGFTLDAFDVLSFRNNFNKIFGTPFDPKDSWVVDACLLPWSSTGSTSSTSSAGSSSPAAASSAASCGTNGTLFLDIVKEGPAWVGDPGDLERFTRWGYRFEALCTGQDVADATSEYGVLVRTRIGKHRILLGAEIDCFDASSCPPQPPAAAAPAAPAAAAAPPQPPPLSSYLELKTYRLPRTAGPQRTLYRFKHPKWWLQSFLAGVTRLVLGGRDEAGMVHRVDLVATADLPRISAREGAPWSAGQALQFGADVLTWMRLEAQQRPGQHLRFRYKAAGSGSGGGSRGGGSGSGSGRDGARSAGCDNAGSGASSGSVITCEVLEGGQLPQRTQQCLQACGLAPS